MDFVGLYYISLMSKEKKSKSSRSVSHDRQRDDRRDRDRIEKEDDSFLRDRQKDGRDSRYNDGSRRFKDDDDDRRRADRKDEKKRRISRSRSPERKRKSTDERRGRSRSRSLEKTRDKDKPSVNTTTSFYKPPSSSLPSTAIPAVKKSTDESLSSEDREKLREAEKAAEQEALDEEMRKRRERVKAWQVAKAKLLQSALGPLNSDANNSTNSGSVETCHDSSGGMSTSPVSEEKGQTEPAWTLEDEGDDDLQDIDSYLPTISVSDSTTNGITANPPELMKVTSLDDEESNAFCKITGSALIKSSPATTKTAARHSRQTSSPLHTAVSLNTITSYIGKSEALHSFTSTTYENGKSELESSKSTLQQSPTAPVPVVEETDDEDDPLDAFMKSLYSSSLDQLPEPPMIKHESVTFASKLVGKGGKAPSKIQINPFGSNYITLEDLMRRPNTDAGMGTTDDKRVLAGWESDIPSSPYHEDDQEREAREDLERQEFISALKKANMLTSAPTALSSSVGESTSTTKGGVEADAKQTIIEEKPNTTENNLGRIFAGEGDIIDETEVEEKKKSALEILEEAKKGKELKIVDHSQIEYIPIRKNLYIVPRVLGRLTEQEIRDKREDLQIKVRGRQCPAPVDTWEQCGLSERTLQVLSKHNLHAPFAVQKQAIPAIMCGRDVIAIAKTGSGKTLAFLLPLFRHIQDQPPIKPSDGPIALIMAPARELALQISREARKFCSALGLSVATIYGGAPVADQIAELKRGADIVVCTPGRMIDILCMQAGKLLSFRRVSFIVMDEADRMFDMGFEPQIRMIIQNIRPDRQTVLFSATFPKQIEKLAKAILRTPLEIVVGERSTVNKDITQIVEVHDEEDKFMRLLQLLGVWYERGNILIFVDKQEKCDQLFHDLLKSGYPCLSLHGGHDQADRDHTLHEFRTQIKTVMVATSACSRGLDVPEIVVVINYNCPNHLEEYVHRVGRTGRAGRKGTAYTFISQMEEQYSPIMIRALEKAEQSPPPELIEMATAFREKVARGEAHWSNSGFGGEGFTFDASEMNETQKIASMQKHQYEIEQGIAMEKEETDYLDDDDIDAPPGSQVAATNFSSTSTDVKQLPSSSSSAVNTSQLPLPIGGASLNVIAPDNPAFAALPPKEKALMLAKQLGTKSSLSGVQLANVGTSTSVSSSSILQGSVDPKDALARAKLIAMQMSGLGQAGKSATEDPSASGAAMMFSDEFEINDYPPQARRKVTQRQAMDDIIERAGVTIISRGTFIPPGKKLEPGERKLFLLIEGTSEMSVKFARMEIQRALEEETLKLGAAATMSSFGRYSVT